MLVLKTIDLFSGIGGIAYGLHSITQTELYCEINPAARLVLESNINKNLIDEAPIHGDINTLINPPPHDMLTFGFPCKGFSVIGKKEGFLHPQHNRFY
jgi:site-specific DNA-cytosine methylase